MDSTIVKVHPGGTQSMIRFVGSQTHIACYFQNPTAIELALAWQQSTTRVIG